MRGSRYGERTLASDGRPKADHVAKILGDDWPLWPTLPIKRNVPLGHPSYPQEMGTLVAGEQAEPIVYLVNAYAFRPKDVMAYQTIPYPSAEALVDDGWCVD
jgi:hypothetical protein